MSGVRYYGGVFWGGLCPGKHLSGKGGLSGAVAPGEDVREKEFVRQFQVTKMLFHVTLGRWWRGFIRWVSPRRACSSVTSEFKDMLIH